MGESLMVGVVFRPWEEQMHGRDLSVVQVADLLDATMSFSSLSESWTKIEEQHYYSKRGTGSNRNAKTPSETSQII